MTTPETLYLLMGLTACAFDDEDLDNAFPSDEPEAQTPEQTPNESDSTV